MSGKIVFKADYLNPEKHESQPYGKIVCSLDGFENSEKILKLTPIKPGLTLSSFCIPSGLLNKFDFEIENSPVEFAYCVKGKSSLNYQKTRTHKTKEFRAQAGMNVVSSISSIFGNFHIHKTEDYKTVGLHTDPVLLKNFFLPYMDNISKEVKELLSNKNKDYYLPLFMNPQMEKIVWEIINSKYQGFLGTLYLESKALELLTVQLESLLNYEKRKKIPYITPDDIDKIYEARNILIKNIENPPTIIGLARLAGINEFKLKKGFKEIFGTTVFGYLKKHRMEYANKLILDGGVNVSQIAYTVGYSNVSHFITAYKNEYGVTPGEYIKKSFFNVA